MVMIQIKTKNETMVDAKTSEERIKEIMKELKLASVVVETRLGTVNGIEDTWCELKVLFNDESPNTPLGHWDMSPQFLPNSRTRILLEELENILLPKQKDNNSSSNVIVL